MTFNSTIPAGSLIPNAFYHLPGDAIRSNKALLNGMKIASYYRSKMKLVVSMAGTITHAGCVLVGVIPPLPADFTFATPQPRLINTILSGPHAFLHANTASTVELDVPWYCNTDLATLDMELPSATYTPAADITVLNGNYATFVAFVLNPLQPSTGSSTTLNITVEAIFENLDILVPCPRYVEYTAQGFFSEIKNGIANAASTYTKSFVGDGLDLLGGWLGITGLHNPNNAEIQDVMIKNDVNRQNMVDGIQHFEKLDPYAHFDRITHEPIFNTTIDEMDIRHIVSKRQYLGTFKVEDTDTIGTKLWIRPISPYQGGIFKQFGSTTKGVIANNIELLHLLSRAWKGTIKITLQSVMNNKQQIKLRSLLTYGPSIKAGSGYPKYNDILQAPSHLMEFTEGGQELSFNLPCLSRNNLIYCMTDSSSEAIFHGIYYIFVAQQLATSAGSPNQIYFNVFYELSPDFMFYGYSTNIFTSSGPAVLKTGATLRAFNEEMKETLASIQKIDIPKIDLKKKRRSPQDLKKKILTKTDLELLHPIFSTTTSKVFNTVIEAVEEIAEPIADAVTNLREDVVEEEISEIQEEHSEEELNQDQVEEEYIAESLFTKAKIQEDVTEKRIDVLLHSVSLLLSLLNRLVTLVSKCCSSDEENYVAESGDIESVPAVMNVGNTDSDKNTDVNKKNYETNNVFRLKPINSVRDYIRRIYPNNTSKFVEVQADFEDRTILPVSDIIGETDFYSTFHNPGTAISKMFYGANCGIKVRIKVLCNKSDYDLRIMFVPPNTFVNKTLQTVDVCPVNSSSLQINGNFQQLPVPYTNIPKFEDAYTRVLEFVIPNMNVYKFVGNPTKMASNQIDYLSTGDLGSIVIHTLFKSTCTYQLQIETGFTDETRLGFHSIAPIIKRNINNDGNYSDSTYMGDFDNGFNLPSATLNPYLYYTKT